MDASVLAALALWPNVPHVYGWLSLDRRGRWRLQDSPVSNPRITEFIGRNYTHDERGAWFFQNGPQRVYVHLDYTPWVLRIGEDRELVTHTGIALRNTREALLDEAGNLLIAFGDSIGAFEDRDLSALLDAVRDSAGKTADEAALSRLMRGEQVDLTLEWGALRLPLLPVSSKEIPARFSFVADPQPADLG